LETTGSSSGNVPNARPGGPPRGLLAELLSLVGSMGRHAESLGALAGEEAREAGALWLRLAVMLFAALFFAAFGYVLLFLSVAFLIAAVFHVSWVWILPGFVLLHLLLVFLCANHVRVHWRTPIFPVTKEEISRDLDALRGGRRP
jgi:uncharacterized membrane protein YqjE